jgi:hypothetical protein
VLHDLPRLRAVGEDIEKVGLRGEIVTGELAATAVEEVGERFLAYV